MTKKRNLLSVSLLLVFGSAVAAPGPIAQPVTFTGSYTTNNYIRSEGDAEAVGTITLTTTSTGTIKADSSLIITYNATIASAPGSKYAVSITCNGGGDAAALCAGIGTPAVTGTNHNILTVPFVLDTILTGAGAALNLTVRVVAQGLAPGFEVFAIVVPYEPLSYLLTNPITISSPASQPYPVAQVGPKAATTTTVTPATVLTCIGATAPATDVFSVFITEDWANALTSQADETALETDTTSGAPTNGSNILITLSGIPSGVTVTPGSVGTCTSVTGTPTGTVACPGGALSISSATASSVSAGVQSFWYKALTTNPLVIENAVFNFTLSSSGPLPLGLPPITAIVSLTDLYPSSAPPTGADMPYFTLPEFTTPQNVVLFSDCVTNLLFPYVNCFSKRGDRDRCSHWGTGIDVANTTKDPFGLNPVTARGSAVPQAGSCTFYFYPSDGSAPVVWTTPTIPSGGSYAFDVGSSAKGFLGKTGYAIAICGFQNANGYAFIGDNYGIGDSVEGTSYLPYVIPNPTFYPRTPAGAQLGEFAIAPWLFTPPLP